MKKVVHLFRVSFSICALLLFAPGSLSAQHNPLRFDLIDRETGLPSSSVSSITQDRYGFLWFGTQGGLAKYDGKNMRVFEHEPFNRTSLPHDLIQTMYMDKERDLLWIGTYKGLSRFDIHTEEFTNYSHDPEDPGTLSNDIVTAITRDSNGVLWAGTLEGLNRFNEHSGTFTRYMPGEGENSLPNSVVRSLLSDSPGNLWIGTYGGLSRYNKEDDSFITYRHEKEKTGSLPSPYVMSIGEEKPGFLWLGLWDGGAVHFNTDSGEFTTVTLPDNRIYAINCENEDTIWAAAWGGGLIRLVPSTGEITQYSHREGKPFGLSNDVVYSLFYDDADILWIGTNGGGINKLDKRKKNYYLFENDPKNPNSLSDGKVTSIRRDSRGTLWIGTYNGGLNRYDAQGDTMVRYQYNREDPFSLSNDIVNSLFEDSSNTLWIGTNEGLNRYIPGEDHFERWYGRSGEDNTLSDTIIYSLNEDSLGNLWIGTYNAGINIYNHEEKKFTYYKHDPEDPESLSNNLVYEIYRTKSGEMWIGTNNGLNRYLPGTDAFKTYYHNPEDNTSLSGDSIRVLYEDSKENLWIGTMSGGLNLYRRGSDDFIHYTKKDGLPDNKIRGIVEDRDGILWVVTEFGLCVFDPGREEFRVIDEDEGVYNREFHTGHWIDRNGNLYIGGTGGVYLFEDANFLNNQHIPHVLITDFRVFDRPFLETKPYLVEEAITLSHRQNFISLDFIALDYAAPKKNHYKYKLEGFDKDWINSGTRNYANYTNLPPGDYVFRVQGANNNGLWNTEGAELAIQVLPPWWRQWWAWVLFAAAAIAIIYLSLEVRVKWALQQKVDELRRTQGELRKAKEHAEAATQAKSDFLSATSHEIRTPLNSIMAISEMLLQSKEHESQRDNYLLLQESSRNMLDILNDILDISRIEAGKISLFLTPFNMEDLIHKTAKSFQYTLEQKGLSLNIAISKPLPASLKGDPMRIRQILVNLLGNAIKFTHRGGITLTVAMDENPSPEKATILFSVKDTGIGIPEDKLERIFEPYEQADESKSRQYGGSGLGLHITRKLLLLMGGSIRVESRDGEGSTFTAAIPLDIDSPETDRKKPLTGRDLSPETERQYQILLVEDNKINARVTAKFLTEWGHSVTPAFSGEAAVSLLKNQSFNVILLDLELPEMSGLELAEKIRSRSIREEIAAIPIIALTGRTSPEVKGECKKQNIDHFLTKPIEFETLKEILRSL